MGKFRVMTWNVQNLLEVGDESGPDTEAQLDAKITALARVIDDARPHVLALQEVGAAPIVGRLQAALAHPLPHAAIGRPDHRGIRVAFISSRTIRHPTDIVHFTPGMLPVQVGDDPEGSAGPDTMDGTGRGALQITVTANGRDVRLVTCHLKSKLLTYPGGRFFPVHENERARFGSYALFRRAAEATTVRTWITDELAHRGRDEPFVLLGDMNDEIDAATTQILNGPPGSEIGTAGFERPDQGDGDRMFNLAPWLPRDDGGNLPPSRVYGGRSELIDHVFASHFLVSEGRTTEVVTRSAGGGPLPSIGPDPTAPLPHPGSDHSAVLVTFDF